jgi:hypothetical protein
MNNPTRYNIFSELQQFKDKKIQLIIGEFADKHPAYVNWYCIHANIDTKKVIPECQKHGIGYLDWS